MPAMNELLYFPPDEVLEYLPMPQLVQDLEVWSHSVPSAQDSVGSGVGTGVGSGVGSGVGTRVGDAVVGTRVGDAVVGTRTGDEVVGTSVGFVVGEGVCSLSVGAGVGGAVGWGVGPQIGQVLPAQLLLEPSLSHVWPVMVCVMSHDISYG